MIYLDSCILIYRLEGAPEFRLPVVEAMRREAGETFAISDLVRLECLVGPIRDGNTERKARFEAQFRQLRRLALTKAAFDLAAELRAGHRVRTADALHAACAMTHGCRQIWTNDRRFAAIEDRLEIRVLP
jgi:predicted nucleic acid-binding protein